MSYTEKIIYVASIVGMNTGLPLVEIRLGSEKAQLDPDEAREVAMNILEASNSAITDLWLVEFAMSRIEIDQARAGQLLNEFRLWRKDREKRGWIP